MTLKPLLSDYTEQEFISLINEINRANIDEPDHIYSSLLLHFAKITEHPSGYDLLFRPTADTENEANEILSLVKEWRAANGKPGFKSE